MKELIGVKNRLKWYVDQIDMRDNIRGYRAIFDTRITDTIRFYIGCRVYMNNFGEWCLFIVQIAPDCNTIASVKCYNPEIGKKMAEDELQKIFDGMKKLLNN